MIWIAAYFGVGFVLAVLCLLIAGATSGFGREAAVTALAAIFLWPIMLVMLLGAWFMGERF